MKDKIEAVAKAMWNAKTDDDDSPRWEELDDTMDRALKEEIRLMAKAAIETVTQSGR